MRKQYVIQEGLSFRYWITTYRDGVKIENTKVWQGNEMDNFIDKLEAEGYERAYTREAVQEAKENYEWLLAHRLAEEER
jgi:hypothetical protein